ncbi:MAG TPA: ABC transporter ATP-binding protein [Acidimicrobiales bacterium]
MSVSESRGTLTELRASTITVEVDGARLLDGVSVTARAGTTLCIVGPNGAGKSTLLRVLAGLLEPAAGEVLGAGRPLARLKRRERAKVVAYVPQDPVLPLAMRVADYVLLGRTPHLAPLAHEGAHDLDIARQSLEQLDLAELAGRAIGTLSGGERQRVLVARALAQQAAVLLLDEPTAALDPGHQLEVLELVDQLRRTHGFTVVCTMHELTLAGQFGDELVLLDRGRVVSAGPAAHVLTDENLSRYYGSSVRVVEADGTRIVVPIRAVAQPTVGREVTQT